MSRPRSQVRRSLAPASALSPSNAARQPARIETTKSAARNSAASWLAASRAHWPIAGVLVCYALAMFAIPTLAPVGVSDDWTYEKSVEYLVWDHRIHILSVAAATQIFQLFWGAAFALLFGMDFGSLRLSTIAIVFLSGIAMYGICRELSISRGRSALGSAAYLFNPVLFPITYTFMSDPHFLGLLVISVYFYLKGFVAGTAGNRATLYGSIVAAIACLQRPHGALIPLGVITYLLIARSLGWNRASLLRFLRIVAIPALTFVGYYFILARGLSSQQALFFDDIRDAGWGQSWLLIRRLTVFEAAYLGLFVLPIILGCLGQISGLLKLRSVKAWLWLAAWTGVVAVGMAWAWGEGRRMPYIPHFLGRGGPGSRDLRLGGAWLARGSVYSWITVICGASAIIFAILLVQKMEGKPSAKQSGAGMVLSIGVWQGIGALPQSFLFRNWIVSLDRYVLPILPFAVALLLWSMNDRKLLEAVAWPAMAAVALFSVAGTRDALVFQDHVWTLAGQMNAQGISNTKLDAGYAWDAYHLWEYSTLYGIPRQTVDGPWWLDYANASDSTYVIAGGPLDGYDVLSVQPYSTWLQQAPAYLMVLRRHGAPADGVVWPPNASVRRTDT